MAELFDQYGNPYPRPAMYRRAIGFHPALLPHSDDQVEITGVRPPPVYSDVRYAAERHEQAER